MNYMIKNEEILGKMDNIYNDRVISTGNIIDEHKHILIIIKNNDDDFSSEDLYNYHALRIMKKSYKSRIINQDILKWKY